MRQWGGGGGGWVTLRNQRTREPLACYTNATWMNSALDWVVSIVFIIFYFWLVYKICNAECTVLTFLNNMPLSITNNYNMADVIHFPLPIRPILVNFLPTSNPPVPPAGRCVRSPSVLTQGTRGWCSRVNGGVKGGRQVLVTRISGYGSSHRFIHLPGRL